MRLNFKSSAFLVNWINYIYNTIILAVQISKSGEITNGLSTYPKIKVVLHLICSRNCKYGDLLSLIPQFATGTFTIGLILNIIFCFFFFSEIAHHLYMNKDSFTPGQKLEHQENIPI